MILREIDPMVRKMTALLRLNQLNNETIINPGIFYKKIVKYKYKHRNPFFPSNTELNCLINF